MVRTALLAGLITACATTPASPNGRVVDPDERAAQLLAAYLRIDTSNPPGNEEQAARFLEARLAEAGITAHVHRLTPGRANLVATAKGDGSARPIVLTHHMDVVGAEPASWRYPPFSGKRVDGEIWGRGALDMKATGIVHLEAIRRLLESNCRLRRDIVYVALADEEVDGVGGTWLAERGAELLGGAELALNEGTTIETQDGEVVRYAVSPMEKSVLWLKLRARGTAGHGSLPDRDSAVVRLVRALDRLQGHPSPIMLTPSVERYFREVAPAYPQLAARLSSLAENLDDVAFIDALARDPYHNALLRHTVSITGLSAGQAANVIPGEAEATLDCRLLPGTSKESFLDWLRGVLADPAIEIEETYFFATQESPVDTELMEAIRWAAGQHHPGVPVVPRPLTSTTDSSVFRRLGIVTYGFEPFPLSEQDLALQHGPNERIRESDLAFGIDFTVDVLRRLACHPDAR